MDADTVLAAVVVSVPALFAALLLGGSAVGWRTGCDNWAIRLVFPRRHTHPALTIIRRVRRTAVAGAATLALSATTLVLPSHGMGFLGVLLWWPAMFVRVGMMKGDGKRRGGPEPLPPGAPRTSSRASTTQPQSRTSGPVVRAARRRTAVQRKNQGLSPAG